MGVPKFFRYISERYPCLSELIKADQVSDFDNLYLDMNGIIHMCSHPDDANPHFRITEEKIFAEIFHYISYLFQLIGPKKIFFMAIDGVAPRAKMNQQRGRRFRTAREMQQQEEKAKENGEKLPEGKRFDSNCITPGTVFMARLQEQLRYFVKQKISSDSAWAKCRVVLSGHETPGEGEHKIMEYIRYLKAQPDHDPNTRHCLYGLDADLIMLGLCSHEPNFSLLREEVKFGRNAQRPSSPDENNFFLLHLSLLRDYLEQEFLSLKEDMKFEFDMEKVIDDWVLMGFLVGNDFIPPLPHLHIHNDALPLLYEIYKKVVIKLDGYINEGGILNLQRFEVFMKELSKVDRDNFQETFADLKYFEAKTGRRPNEHERKSYKHVPDDKETFGVNVEEIKAEGTKPLSAFQSDLQALIDSTNQMGLEEDGDDKEWGDIPTDEEDSSDESESSLFNAEFTLHKRDYYINKLDYPSVTADVLRSQAECYVRAVQWVLHYYYQGCASWSWFYPHHYAPYISDVVNFKDMNLIFDMAKPFKPFEQLLAVLPSASKDLLPEPFHYLMTNDHSPIQNYYPLEFQTDLNGKKNEWEAVVLIPFIDEVNLLEAMEPFYEQLTEEETQRNTHGPMHIYEYTSQDLGECRAPEYFPTVRSCHAKETKVWLSELAVPPGKVVRGPLPNPTRGLLYPGIPTLKHINFKSHFTKARVKVFDNPSRNDNCILKIIHDNSAEPDIKTIAGNLLGKVVWAGWPHLVQTKVVEVSNRSVIYKYTAEYKEHSSIEDDVVTSISEDTTNIKQWELQSRTIVEHNSNRLGIDVGCVTIIVHAVSLKGYQFIIGPSGKLVTGAKWCTVSSPYPLQAVLPKLDVAPLYSTRVMSAEEALPAGDKVFIKTGPYYGCIAEIVDSSMVQKLGRVKICVFMEPEPTVQPLSPHGAPAQTLYFPTGVAAAKCGVAPFLFSCLTGCIFVSTSNNPDAGRGPRVNIGLNIKFSRKNEELVGYTRRVDNRWLYSQKVVDLMVAYAEKFPQLFHNFNLKKGQDNFTLNDLFPDCTGDSVLKEVCDWLKAQPYNSCSVRSCDSLGLEPEQIVYIRDTVASQQAQLESERKRLALQVKPHVLYKPELHLGTILPDTSVATFNLYDRVINVNPKSTVPLGLKGTVISICQLQPRGDSVSLSDKLNTEPIYQILFDKPFLGGINSDGIGDNRMFRMQGFNFLNITQGRSLNNKMSEKAVISMKLSPSNTRSDNFNILRNNDGHNSAFANYNSPTKNYAVPGLPINSGNIQNATPPPLLHPSPKVQTTPDDSYTQLLKCLLKINETKNTVVQHQPPAPLDNNVFLPPYLASKGNNNTASPQNQNFLQMLYSNNVNPQPVFPPIDFTGFGSTTDLQQESKNGGQIPSRQFYNSKTENRVAPSNLQLPFPQKLIENVNKDGQNALDDGQQGKTSQSCPRVPAPFIPLQAVTRQRNSAPIGKKNYKKVYNQEKQAINLATKPQREDHNIPTVVQVNPDNPSKKAPNKKKSRIAANFKPT